MYYRISHHVNHLDVALTISSCFSSGAWHQAQLAKEERGYAEESAAATQRRARECEERMREMAEEFARERDLHAAQSDERLGDLERLFLSTTELTTLSRNIIL